MIVVQLLGGLGNQMFQYACGRALALRTGKKLYLDLRHYAVDTQRSYELDKLNIQAGLIHSFDELKEIGFRLGIQGISVWKERHFNFDPAVLSLREPVILAEGYWQSEQYFQEFSDTIRQELTPSCQTLSSETLSLGMKMSQQPSVAIHVRRGDYLGKAAYHAVLGMEYYQRAIHYIGQKNSDVRFYIFSDDTEWCKEQFASLPNCVIVEHTRGKGSQEDLWLMSRCRHNIIANSTYSWWGGWLNESLNKIVIAPEQWFNDLTSNISDLIPKQWITLPVGYERKNPKVSICIPAYRQPALLKRCLASIDRQSFKDYEIIITDDSRDDCLKPVVDEFSSMLTIKYIKNEQQLGSPANWNFAMEHASGEYIKILHHDDWFYDEQSLGAFVEMLDQNPQAGVAFCSSRHYEQDVYISSHILPTEEIQLLYRDPKRLFLANIIGAPSAVIFRKCDLLFDDQLKWLVDLDFYIQLLSLNPNFVYTQQPLICIDAINETKMTTICENNKTINLFEYFYLFDKLQINHFSKVYIDFFIRLFLRYDVQSLEEIRQSGYQGHINEKFAKILFIKEIVTDLRS
ncbi:alpha-1,2-fucosyltransferase [Pelosinus sp. sgz500959]|uniref:alpha-1,2-fucosyltransferase n=1 Tax=Pelosinus sp. sgz500959 TaxID=3242472 RepID=UPI00366CE18D